MARTTLPARSPCESPRGRGWALSSASPFGEAVQQFKWVESLLIAVLCMLMPTEILAVTIAFLSVMPMSSDGDV